MSTKIEKIISDNVDDFITEIKNDESISFLTAGGYASAKRHASVLIQETLEDIEEILINENFAFSLQRIKDNILKK